MKQTRRKHSLLLKARVALKALKGNMFAQFSITAFLYLAVIAIILIVVLSSALRSHEINRLVNEATEHSMSHILQEITPADLSTPMRGEKYEVFHEFIKMYVITGQTAQIKLWAKDGTVIYYSADPVLIGERFPDHENVSKAMTGDVVTGIEEPEQLESEGGKYSSTMMEVYVPIVFPGFTEPQGILEIYQDYECTGQLIDRLNSIILLTISAGFVVLYGTLVSSVWRGWRTIVRQRRERQEVDQQKEKIQAQLNQSQKMEAVGKLAGGVAHDLNNMLTPILGFGELLLEKSNSDEERREYLEEIMKAGRRARDIVRQLLAFSRKQTIEFKTIDLNILLKDFEKLLRSTIREDINIRLIPSKSLPLILGDVGQLEQVTMNLVVNAQDAMPDGGELTIETTTEELAKSYTTEHMNVPSGPHIMLSISDTGCGMDAETCEQIFEPFFTTKDKHRGTGLGLSTVYGIVKQHGGNIQVYSEPGKGTTFNVYLPVSRDTPSEQKTIEIKHTDTHGSETVLLAEDDEIVRKLALTILKQSGYTVLVAENGAEALLALESHDGPLHLLLTDVVMPDMNGRELFSMAVEKYPSLKVLYMSGYTDDVIAHHGVLDEGVAFIQKPFAIHDLAAKIREVLD